MAKHKLVPVNNEAMDSNNGVQQDTPKVSKIKEFGEKHPKVVKGAKIVGLTLTGLGAAFGAFMAGRASASGSDDQYDDEYSDEPYEESFPGEDGDE